MARVQLRGVGKVYDGDPPVRACEAADLELDDGEFVVLVGPSGCGKSTLLRLVAGLEVITEGTITIGDRVVNGVAPRDRDIAMVFQDYALYPHMTVQENMSLALKLRKVPAAEIHRRVRDAAELLDLHGLMERRPAELSGGQQQRVAVGRAIVRQPACFLFDEPLSNLDARLRLHMRAELKSLHQRLKTTTLYVTHDQEEAMTLGTRIVVMADGTIQQVGTPLDVYRNPCNRFVAGFLGTPPMNFIPGEMRNHEFVGGGVSFSFNGIARTGPTVVGIRPEALVINGKGIPIVLNVDVVEPLGDRMDLYLRTMEGVRVTARVPASEDVEPGTTIGMTVETAAVYLFDVGEYGARLR